MSTWEMGAAIARRERVSQTMVIPAFDRAGFEKKRTEAIEQFDLGGAEVDYVPVVDDCRDRGELMRIRDRYVVSNAHVLVPVSVRPGGGMEKHLAKREHDGARVIRRYETQYESRTEPLRYHVEHEELNPALDRIDGQHVIHWTRSSNGPWPTERALDYYEAILTSRTYPRDGFATLCNILERRRICASPRHMPGGTPAVSFSDSPPNEFARLMRWRARYREMSFEPYGIGIGREYAVKCGIRPVRYYEGSDKPNVSGREAWLLQSAGKRSDWRNEDEYRFRGDFELPETTDDRLIAFCHTTGEAALIRRKYGMNAVAFVRGPLR